jgi:hypothetical protein
MFLDNLFLNVEIAHCLLAIDFAVIDITRKNTAGIPYSLLKIKNEEKNKRKK